MKENTIYISILLTVIILCLLSLFLIIYYVIYRQQLKQALLQESEVDNEKKHHRKKNHTNAITAIPVFAMAFLCIVFISASVFSVSGIMEIGMRLDKISENEEDEKRISYGEDYILDKLWMIIDNMDKQSIVRYCGYTYGNYHPETHTIDITLKVVPKTAGKSDVLTFKYDDQVVTLKPDERGAYYGTFQADIMKNYAAGILTLDNGITKVSELIDNDIAHDTKKLLNYKNFIPSIDFKRSEPQTEEMVENNTAYHYKTKGDILITPPVNYDGFEVTSVKLLYQLNGKTFLEKDITEDYLTRLNTAQNSETAIPDMEVEYTYKNCTDNDMCSVYIRVLDKVGYTYDSLLYTSNGGNYSTSDATLIDYDDNITIVTDPNGVQLKKWAGIFFENT